MTPPPAPETATPETRAPAKAPEMARGAVTPPPPPTVPEPPQASRSASPLPPDLPPITPAPRETRRIRQRAATARAGNQQEREPDRVPAPGHVGQHRRLRARRHPRHRVRRPVRRASASAGEATLKAAAQALTANAALRVELKAYATGDKDNELRARRLSLSRALAVRSFLIKEGVQATRIDVRALGSQVPSGPADRVDVTLISR